MIKKATGTAIAVLTAAAVSLSGCKSDDSTAAPTGATTAASAPAEAAPTSSAPAADNGVAKLSADEIVKRATTALTAAKSFHVAGNSVQDGQKMLVDLKVVGKDGVGSMTIGKAKIQLLRIGGTGYMKPNEAFWAASTSAKQAKTIAAVVGDRWVKVPADDKQMAGMFSLFKPGDMVKPDGKVTKGAAKELDGLPVITITDHGTAGGAMYVATTGKPYPIEVDGKDKSKLKFDGFDATYSIKKPATADVLDFASLSGK